MGKVKTLKDIEKEEEPKEKGFVKLRRGIFIPEPLKKERGNPKRYFAVPQEGEPTEYDIEIKFCPNCNKDMPCINKFIKNPIQPEDMLEGKALEKLRKECGLKKGEIIESSWLQLCKKCNTIVEDGINIIETDGGYGNSSQG